MSSHTMKAVLFDFGGVLAEEGFRKGLSYIASSNGLDPEEFFITAQALIISSGYLTGRSTEAGYWNRLRALTGISGNDYELRQIILKRFILRDWMIDLVKRLKKSSIQVAILSDQTNWLDELDSRLHFFSLFDFVFNSFHLGKSKNDPSLFIDVLNIMGPSPHETLFIDDTIAHVLRARSKGLHAIHYTGKEPFLIEMKMIVPST